MYPLSTYTARLLQSASFFTLLRQGEFSQLCPYHGVFNQLQYRHCTTGCCGDYHKAYCCINRHFREISAGSIGGFILLVGLICLTVCCYRRMQQRRERGGSLGIATKGFRNYGTLNNKTTDQHKADPSNTANPDVRPDPGVHLTITPPTPTPLAQEEVYNQPYPKAPDQKTPVTMGNQPSSPRVEVVTYEEPVAPPPEVEVDVTVDEYGNVIETETVVLPEPEPYPPYEAPVVIETVSEPYPPGPYIEGNPYYRPYGGVTEVVYNPYPAEPEPVVIEEYYGGGGEPDVEVTTYPGEGYPAGYVEYNDDPFPDTDPYYSDDMEPYQ